MSIDVLVEYLDGPVGILLVLGIVAIWRRYVAVQKEKDRLNALILDAFIRNTTALTELKNAIESR